MRRNVSSPLNLDEHLTSDDFSEAGIMADIRRRNDRDLMRIRQTQRLPPVAGELKGNEEGDT